MCASFCKFCKSEYVTLSAVIFAPVPVPVCLDDLNAAYFKSNAVASPETVAAKPAGIKPLASSVGYATIKSLIFLFSATTFSQLLCEADS